MDKSRRVIDAQTKALKSIAAAIEYVWAATGDKDNLLDTIHGIAREAAELGETGNG